MASLYPEGMDFPLKVMIQFDRVTGQFRTEFEDADSARWQVTPDNFMQVIEEMRPAFD